MEPYDLMLKKTADVDIFTIKNLTKVLDHEMAIALVEYSEYLRIK